MNLKVNHLKTLYTATALLFAAPIITYGQTTQKQNRSELASFLDIISSSPESDVTYDVSHKATISYGSTSILGKSCYLPMLKYEFSSYNSDHAYCKPNIAVSTKHVEAALPIGHYFNTKNFKFEVGADLLGIKHAFNPSNFNTNATDNENQKLGELYSDINAGVKYQNKLMNFNLIGAGGVRNYYQKKSSENIQNTNTIKDHLFIAIKAILNLTPFKNKNLSFKAEGIHDSKKDLQYSAGIEYKF